MGIEKVEIWEECLANLKEKYSGSEFETWIQPLQAEINDGILFLFAPNDFVVDWVKEHFLDYIIGLIKDIRPDESLQVKVEKGSKLDSCYYYGELVSSETTDEKVSFKYGNRLNPSFTFDRFVKGKCNEFAFATAFRVATEDSSNYNPLLIYGGVGLGKTHLMQAIGNSVLERRLKSKVLYLHSERFVANMIKALQSSTIENFQKYYRSVDFLLIDDIQFLAGKDRSQEEFFHTFNALMEDRKQIVLTCDRYPKEIGGLKERLRSRFGWGLTVAIEPPDIETRVAILMSKAEIAKVHLPSDAAFFMAKRIRSNVRELEGALKRVTANADFTDSTITLGLVKDVLKDLITLQDKLVTIENIQRVVAEYYRIKISDLLSKHRCRSVVRPRQIAMFLAKELTDRSLPEIGTAFGGKDHTTVLHANKKIKELLETNAGVQEDYSNLIRILTG